MIDEFQRQYELDEIEMLRSIIPSWEKAELEPFLVSAQQDVVPPTWDKLEMPDMGFFNQGGDVNAIQVTVTGCLNGSPAVGTALYSSPPQNF